MDNNDKEIISDQSNDTIYSKKAGDKKPKRKAKFNFIDLILIIAFIGVTLAVIFYFVPGASKSFSATEKTEISYTLEFTGVDSSFITSIENGDPVYDSAKNYMMGNVRSVENYSHTTIVYDEASKTSVMKEVPNLKNIIVTVTASAIYTDGEGYFVNGERIAVGKGYNIRFPGFSGKAYCIEVSSTSNS